MLTHFYELQIELESECLLDCIHCSSLETRNMGKRRYSDQDIIELITMMEGPVHIYFTGGEPLLYRNLDGVCATIKNKKSNCLIGLYTTGNMRGFIPISDECASTLARSGITDCYFSLYSTVPSYHDLWVKREGAFHNTLESVKSVQKAGISTKAHVVLNRDNYDSVENIIDFCSQRGLEEVRILKLAPSGAAADNWGEIGVDSNIQNSIIRKIVQSKENYRIPVTVSGYPDIHPCRSFLGAKGCQAGINLLYIDIYGDIYPCAAAKKTPHKYRICNIKEMEVLKEYLLRNQNKENNPCCINQGD